MENKTKETKFFKATIKGGHIRRSHYVIFWHYIRANSSKEAAEICKSLPRAKKDHKDFIINIEEITFEEYQNGYAEELNDPYLQCRNKQEQDKIIELIQERIIPDPHYFEVMPKEKRNHYIKQDKKCRSKKSYVNRYVDHVGDWRREYVMAS